MNYFDTMDQAIGTNIIFSFPVMFSVYTSIQTDDTITIGTICLRYLI
jgi:hypothetical protein